MGQMASVGGQAGSTLSTPRHWPTGRSRPKWFEPLGSQLSRTQYPRNRKLGKCCRVFTSMYNICSVSVVFPRTALRRQFFGTQHSHHPLFQNHYSGVTQQSGGKLSSLRIQTYFCWWVSPCLLVLPLFFPHLARYLIWTCLSYPFRIPSHRPWQLGIGRLSSSHCFSKSVLVGDGKEIQLEIHCQSHRENTYHRRPPGLQFGVAHAAGYLILLEIISPLYKFECARVSHPSWKTIGYYCMTSEL